MYARELTLSLSLPLQGNGRGQRGTDRRRKSGNARSADFARPELTPGDSLCSLNSCIVRLVLPRDPLRRRSPEDGGRQIGRQLADDDFEALVPALTLVGHFRRGHRACRDGLRAAPV